MSLLSHKLALLKQRQSSPPRLRVISQFSAGQALIQIQHHKDGEIMGHAEIAKTLQSQGHSHWQKSLGTQFEKVQHHLLAQRLNPAEELWRIPLPLFQRQLPAWLALDPDIALPTIPSPVHIHGLNTQFKPFDYQFKGIAQILEWLQIHKGGIMADDMGLGKTLQTLCALSQLQCQQPILLLCPASLCGNWLAECKRFFPALKILDLSHSKRTKERWRIKQSQIVLLSLGTARSDLEWIQAQNWGGLVLDEAHLVKNPHSQLYKGLKSLSCPWKLALTGTPLSNHPKEWHALLDLIHPNQWGERSEFSAQLKQSSWLKSAQYYLLRRRKEEVLKDLPPCEEIDLAVELTSSQEEAYLEALQAKEEILEKFSQEGYAKAAISLFALIQRLRKICNAPDYIESSPKALRLLELLHTQHSTGSKTLVFSQSRDSLRELERLLQIHKIPTLKLTGETPSAQRTALVEQFNNSPEPVVFLLSTHAAGVGLNLTAANACVFFDSDWNPSWDAQAKCRAHRIGQKQSVRIFKLICKGTFEEKLLKRARQKWALTEELLSQGIQNDWNLEEMSDLLSYWRMNQDL